MQYGDFREVVQNGRSVGCMTRKNEGVIKAVLYRPKAQSNKDVGTFSSWRQARQAIYSALNDVHVG